MRHVRGRSVLPIVLLCLVARAGAVDFDVDTFDDVVNAGDNLLSLREAVIAANGNEFDDVIRLQAGTYVLSLGGDDDTAAGGDLDLTEVGQTVRIEGAGADQTSIDAGKDRVNPPPLGDRVLHILTGVTVHLDGVNITGGDNSGPGGGISNLGTLTITDGAVSGNTSSGAGGVGGAINNVGELTLTNSAVSGNTANGSGGGIFNGAGMLTITNSAVSGNMVTGLGGGIFSLGGITKVR